MSSLGFLVEEVEDPFPEFPDAALDVRGEFGPLLGSVLEGGRVGC